MRILIAVVLAAAALWSGYWFVGSQALEGRLKAWFEARRGEGWVAEVGAIDVRGFPNRFDTTLSELDLADPETGLAWSAPFFQLLALSYRPHHVIAVWPHEQAVATPAERIEVVTRDMRASVVFDGGTDLALDRATLVLDGLRLQSSLGWEADLPEGRFATRRRPGSRTAHQIGAEVHDLTLGPGLRERLDPGRALPPEIDTLHLDMTVDFDAPWDRRAVEAARPQPTRLDLDDLSARWGALSLRAAGELTVDAAGIPTGRVTVEATNWREMIALAVGAGILPEALSGTVERALEVLAGLSGTRDTLDVPLAFADGRVSFGPVPLGPAPRLVLR